MHVLSNRVGSKWMFYYGSYIMSCLAVLLVVLSDLTLPDLTCLSIIASSCLHLYCRSSGIILSDISLYDILNKNTCIENESGILMYMCT